MLRLDKPPEGLRSFCTKCGTEAEADDLFCRDCGASTGVQAAVAAAATDRTGGADDAPAFVGAGTTVAAPPRPSFTVPAAATLEQKRSRWMVPAIAAMALAVVVVVIAGIAVFSVGSNDDNESLEVVATRALVAVRASADAADEEASAVESRADLDAVARAGSRLAGSSESASATLAAAEVTEDENPSRGLLTRRPARDGRLRTRLGGRRAHAEVRDDRRGGRPGRGPARRT